MYIFFDENGLLISGIYAAPDYKTVICSAGFFLNDFLYFSILSPVIPKMAGPKAAQKGGPANGGSQMNDASNEWDLYIYSISFVLYIVVVIITLHYISLFTKNGKWYISLNNALKLYFGTHISVASRLRSCGQTWKTLLWMPHLTSPWSQRLGPCRTLTTGNIIANYYNI